VCGFEFLDQESERIKLEAICKHLGVLSPSGIQRIRERYGMTQAKFAEVTGLGTATLVRWENGAMNHTRAYDRYIRLLENPEIMEQLKRLAEPGGESGTDLGNDEDPQFRVVRVTRSSH
jgi:DNA-binding transcriptional regulator YiaG